MRLRLAIAAVSLPLFATACGGGDAQHVLVYEKPAVSLPSWGWIWRAAPDGSHPQKVVLGYSPVVSPDGHWIAYLHREQQTIGRATTSRMSLWLVSSEGGRPRQIGETSRWFEILAWSPGSKRFLVLSPPGLQVVDRSRGTTKLLVPTGRQVGVGTASFSPDGRAIVYDRAEEGKGFEISTVPADGGAPRPLTSDSESFQPLWGPTAIAYFHGLGNTRGDVWLMEGDGSHKRQLTHTGAAFYPVAWSRDGRRLLAANPATHNGRLWAVDVPSGRARPLTPWVGDLFSQGLSPDGSTVYAAIGCGGRASPYGVLETIPFTGGRPKLIVRGPCRGSWSR